MIANNATIEEESIALRGTFHRAYVVIILNLISSVTHKLNSHSAWISLNIARKDLSKKSIRD